MSASEKQVSFYRKRFLVASYDFFNIHFIVFVIIYKIKRVRVSAHPLGLYFTQKTHTHLLPGGQDSPPWGCGRSSHKAAAWHWV